MFRNHHAHRSKRTRRTKECQDTKSILLLHQILNVDSLSLLQKCIVSLILLYLRFYDFAIIFSLRFSSFLGKSCTFSFGDNFIECCVLRMLLVVPRSFFRLQFWANLIKNDRKDTIDRFLVRRITVPDCD